MRLFVAVQLSDEVLDAAADVAARLRRRLPPAVEARWVPRTNMHLTVRFIGQVVDARVPPLLDVLKPRLSIAPFDVTLGTCGVFPPAGAPRVIWIGLADGFEPLRAMHEEFSRRVEPLGFASEERPFSVHLTLARVKDAPRASRSIHDSILSTRPRPATARITAATVFESRLSPNGPTYRPLVDVACTG